MYRVWRKSFEPFSISLLKPKIGKQNLNLHQCFCSKRLFYPKKHLKRNYYMLFQKDDSNSFSRHALPKSKIGLPNLDFNEFSCGKRLIHSEKHANKCLFIKFEENRSGRFSDIHFQSHFWSALPHLRFPDFLQNLEILFLH